MNGLLRSQFCGSHWLSVAQNVNRQNPNPAGVREDSDLPSNIQEWNQARHRSAKVCLTFEFFICNFWVANEYTAYFCDNRVICVPWLFLQVIFTYKLWSESRPASVSKSGEFQGRFFRILCALCLVTFRSEDSAAHLVKHIWWNTKTLYGVSTSFYGRPRNTM